jgi:hypothetical protein
MPHVPGQENGGQKMHNCVPFASLPDRSEVRSPLRPENSPTRKAVPAPLCAFIVKQLPLLLLRTLNGGPAATQPKSTSTGSPVAGTTATTPRPRHHRRHRCAEPTVQALPP